MSPGDRVKCLRLRGRLQETPTVSEGDDLVLVAVKNKERNLEASDLCQRVIAASEEISDARKGPVGDCRDGEKQGFQNQPGRWTMESQFEGHGGAQRATEVDDALQIETRPSLERGKSGPGIAIEPLLGWTPLASAVASIVEDENGKTEPVVDLFDVFQTVTDIPRVAVSPKEGPRRATGNKPAVEPDAIFRSEGHVLVGEIVRSRVTLQGANRIIDQRSLNEGAAPPEQEGGQRKKPRQKKEVESHHV